MPSRPTRGHRLLQAIAVGLCLALPAGFYGFGDAVDAFPGVLTMRSEADPDRQLPPASGEALVPAPETPLALESPEESDYPDAEALSALVAPHLGEAPLRGSVAISVRDVATGDVVLDRDAATVRTPASTVKLLTAAAAYRELDPDATLDTRAVLDGDDLYLVGGGDMLLTSGPPRPDAVNGHASLADLADQVATALTAGPADDEAPGNLTLHLDGSLYTGPAENPAWAPNGSDGGWVAPTATVALDGGDLGGGLYGPKEATPGPAAAAAFADLLAERGVPVDPDAPIERGSAPADAADLGAVSSAPIGEIIGHTLQISDNTTAEVLGRQVALARGAEPSAAGAAAAVADVATELAADLGIDATGLVLLDTCGLADENRIAPAFLSGLLAAVASGESPELTPMLAQLPISGLDGTLALRFDEGPAASAAGIVRGKTGYLGGATSLAGVSVSADGRPVAFSLVGWGFPDGTGVAAREQIDRIAAQLAADY